MERRIASLSTPSIDQITVFDKGAQPTYPDTLGDAFCLENSAKDRRGEGITLTPLPLVDSMIAIALRRAKDISRVVDCGAGTGRFAISAAKAYPMAEVIAIEHNENLAVLLQQNIKRAGLARRVKVVVGDFRNAIIKPIAGKTLFIGNPPYVRHHQITADWKQWYQRSMFAFGLKASQLAGLHLHFFAKAFSCASPGDIVFFITAAEWLEVEYGKALRDLLLTKTIVSEITLLNPRIPVFEDAMTTSVLALSEVGKPSGFLAMRRLDSVQALLQPNGFAHFSNDECNVVRRWSQLGQPQVSKIHLNGTMELGELFAVHRGQVTGMNSVWIAGNYEGVLPAKVCFPTITRATDLLSLQSARLEDAKKLRRVIDLPADISMLGNTDQMHINTFLKWAKAMSAHAGYVASHRKQWYRVGLPAPAPIVMTYMARRAPRFVRNVCGARIINVAHGLYPRAALDDNYLDQLTDWLNENVSIESGRTYAGGLTKFEPGEAMRLRIPRV